MRQFLSRFPEFEGLANELSRILLFSLAVTVALFEASQFAGFARLMEFLVAVCLVYKKSAIYNNCFIRGYNNRVIKVVRNRLKDFNFFVYLFIRL